MLTVVTFIILMCYGGGFGTMPAFAADYFGSKNIGPIYGLMLTAWGFASAFGPLLIAYLRQSGTSFAYRAACDRGDHAGVHCGAADRASAKKNSR